MTELRTTESGRFMDGFVACTSIPLDGEVLRRIIGKAVVQHLKSDIIEAVVI